MFGGLSERRAEALRWLAVLTVVGLGWVLYTMPPAFLHENALFAELIAQLDFRVFRPMYGITFYWLLTLEFGAVLAVALAMQLCIPVRRGESFFSSHVLNDLMWFVYSSVIYAFTTTVYVVWLVGFLEPYFASFHPAALDAIPVPIRFVLVLLLLELLVWSEHCALHKIPILWQFHAVHHSQTELSFFSDFRIHLVEHLWRATIVAVPMAALHIDLPLIVAYTIFDRWYSRFYHSNLKTHYGPLKYFMVTPQSHRMHHTNDPKYADRNFGRYLTLWDWVFGTQVKDWDVYPATGIDDRNFPLEEKRLSIRILWMPIVQHWYPVEVLARQAWRRLSGGTPAAAAGVRTPSE